MAAIAMPALDRRGNYRSPVTLAEYRTGRPAPNKGMKLPAEPLTNREMLELLAAFGRHYAGRRDRALVVVMWRGGLRIAEALALYPKDIDLEAGHVRVLHGKGNRARTVGLDPMACSVIADWLELRARLGLRGTQPVFCVITKGASFGAAMHSSCLRESLKRAAARAGIYKRVHPHGLRHTHAFELAQEGVPVSYIQRQLGHGNLGTTARYIDHLNPAAVVDVMRQRAWPQTAGA